MLTLGARVRHLSRPDLGHGRLVRLYGDGRCDVVFDGASFSGVRLSAYTSVDAEVVLVELDALLSEAKFDEARAYFGRHATPYLTEVEFKQRLIRAQEADRRRQAELEDARNIAKQEQLRGQINKMLDAGELQAANKIYVEQCSDWWHESDYTTWRDEVECLNHFADGYSESSLSSLDAQYSYVLAERMTAAEFSRLKLPKLRLRLARLGMPLDDEQLLACARPEQYRLIRARAGSGKTRTLAALAALVMHDESLEPDQVLVLAFNKKAAREIGDRIRSAAGIAEFRNARTFHSLAYQLTDHAEKELIFDDGQLAPSRRKQTGYVERTIESIMNPAFRELLYEFFRRELEQLDELGSDLSAPEYFEFRLSMMDYTLGGDEVKSTGEKLIADFLFEHDIHYRYEKVYSWAKQNRLQGTPYRPDFSILHRGQDFILEHWAIDPNDRSAEVPAWWNITTDVYRTQISEKRAFWTARGVPLLETHAGMLVGGRDMFEASLRTILEGAGIHCIKLDHGELIRRVAESPRTASRMAELFLQFISRAKKRGWGVDDIASIVADVPDTEPRNRIFHELAIRAYAAYEQRLVAQSAMDFDDLLAAATDVVRLRGGSALLHMGYGDSIAIRNLRWVLIDEFQDFSELYYQLIAAILKANPALRIVCVGDDWQAINGFAGGQLTYFDQFGDYFRGAGEAAISTNRRSGRRIVSGGNRLMDERGEPALAYGEFEGEIKLERLNNIWPERDSIYLEAATNTRDDGRASVNFELARALKACADFIVNSVYTVNGQRWLPSVLILARTSRVYGVELDEFARRIERVLRFLPEVQKVANRNSVRTRPSATAGDYIPLIEVMTAHKSKGKEADTVIVLEATLGHFPKIHADNQLFGPFGLTVSHVLAEERRLFYVAVTRAKYRLMLLSESGKESPYLDEVLQGTNEDRPRTDRTKEELDGFAGRVHAQLNECGRAALIMNNVSPAAASAWRLMRHRALGLPDVGFSLTSDLYAELAWPKAYPPLAILTGHYRAKAKEWIAHGWCVLTA